jgi:1,4-dihydroxy-2-naphthoate octaprenyltransferase
MHANFKKPRITFWLDASRKQALPQSVIPAVLALTFATHTPGFSWIAASVALVGIVFLHLSMNLFDDYFDFRARGTTDRHQVVHEGFRARLGKCRYLEEGSASLSQLLRVAILFLFIAAVMGSIIFALRGLTTILFASIVLVLGVFYSAYPLRLSYRGLGEIVVGFIFGPLLMMGMCFASCGSINADVVMVSIPVGILVSVILFVHAILDFEPDKRVGKVTLAVKVNNKKASVCILAIMLCISYVTVVWGTATGMLSLKYLAVLLTLPIAIGLQYSVMLFVRDPHRSVTPRWWMGRMESWDRIRQTGIEWFMVRWFLARNLLTYYCLILLVVNLLPFQTGKIA